MFKKISIVIPVFNEEKFITDCLERVIAAAADSLEKEIIIVDDGSTDKTVSKVRKYIETIRKVKSYKSKVKNQIKKLGVLENYKPIAVSVRNKDFEIILIQKKENEGKGKAIREGFLKSTGDIVLVQDADLEYNPSDYPALLSPILAGEADVVYGSRFITEKAHRVLYFWHFVGNSLITLLSNMITNLNFTDIYCGYKVFKGDIIRNIAKNLTSDSFEVEAEITKRLSKIRNIKCYEVGISYFGRTYAEGKKIRPWDAVSGVWKLIVS